MFLNSCSNRQATKAMFKGSFCALATPFRNGGLDVGAIRALVDWHLEAGTHGLVPCGTTGESATLTHDEHKAVIDACVDQAAGRAPVVAGAGSNNTLHAIEFAAHAKAAGAHAALLVVPYYNKPTQEGLYAHFMAIADAVEIPQILYNIPGRSVVDMSPETMGRLAQHPNIIGVKDATADVARVDRQRETCGQAFIQLSGDDSTALGFMAHGGAGCISVTANIAPHAFAAMMNAALAGDFARARQINQGLAPLHKALVASTNPGPAKYALARMGRCAPDLRLPLVAPNAEAEAVMDAALAHYRASEAGRLEAAAHV